MEAQIPDGYPERVEVEKKPCTITAPANLPLEALAIPEWVLEKIGGQQSSQAPNPDGATDPISAAPPTVLEGPDLAEQPSEIQGNKQPKALTPEKLAKADEIIRAVLAKEAAGQKCRGWKAQRAKTLNRHPAWVTNRIKHVQAQGQQVAA